MGIFLCTHIIFIHNCVIHPFSGPIFENGQIWQSSVRVSKQTIQRNSSAYRKADMLPMQTAWTSRFQLLRTISTSSSHRETKIRGWQQPAETVICPLQSFQPAASASGRLKASFIFWKNTLKANDFILETIQYGYRIPFISMPPPCYLRNNASCRGHDDFISSEICDLLAKGYIEEVHSPPHCCCNPLTVAKGKKLRLILDLRHVNHVNHVNRYGEVKGFDHSCTPTME